MFGNAYIRDLYLNRYSSSHLCYNLHEKITRTNEKKDANNESFCYPVMFALELIIICQHQHISINNFLTQNMSCIIITDVYINGKLIKVFTRLQQRLMAKSIAQH